MIGILNSIILNFERLKVSKISLKVVPNLEKYIEEKANSHK